MKRKWKENEKKDEISESKKKREWKKEIRANHKPRGVLTKEKKYKSLNLRKAGVKNRNKNKTGEYIKYEKDIRRNQVKRVGEVDT